MKGKDCQPVKRRAEMLFIFTELFLSPAIDDGAPHPESDG